MDMENNLNNDVTELGQLIVGMKAAYARGENVMEYARQAAGGAGNSSLATLIAYDLQAGTYIAYAKKDPDARSKWCAQLAHILDPLITGDASILEVGCGEATTLAGVLSHLENKPAHALGFDISWSRCAHANQWLNESKVSAELFVADLFEIPLEDNSIDVVYTSHSLEPNGGKEEAAIKELMRVARKAVVLIEPIYELAGPDARDRMDAHGYVKGLKSTAERLGARVNDYRLLEYCGNPLNPSGLVMLEKQPQVVGVVEGSIQYRCPLTHTALEPHEAGYYSRESGLVYPVLSGIPMLRSTHAIVASHFGRL
jgi:SAM-dependent methyltransferase